VKSMRKLILPLLALGALLLLATAGVAVAAPPEGPPDPFNIWQLHYGKDVYGEPIEGDAHPMPPPLMFALLNFGIFVALVVWKGGPAIRRFVRQRHTDIKDALEEAAKLRDDARAVLEDHRRRLDRADAEIESLVAEIRAEAEAEKERILEQAKTQAAALEREAETRIEAELARARAALEIQVVAAAVVRAEEILREKTTPADHAGLVDGFIRDIAPGGPPKTPPSGSPPPKQGLDEGWT
jgi:F-type H+-transporting ATPase subunit b